MSSTFVDDLEVRVKREEMRKISRERAESMMRLAGFTIEHVWELANRYWPDSPVYDDVREPWWLFLTEFGPIVIGRRKRVFHLEWEACAYRGVVTTDDVSKTDTYVHAWSVEDAVRYLRALYEGMGRKS